MLLHYLFSTTIFMLTALMNLLTAILNLSGGLAAQECLLLFIPILSMFSMQELTIIFTFSSLTLVNSRILCLCLCFHLPMTWNLQKRSAKTLLILNWTFTPYLNFSYCSLYMVWRQAEIFFTEIYCPLACTKKFQSRCFPLYSAPRLKMLSSHVWRAWTHTATPNRVESKVFRLINSPPLTNCLDSLSHRRNVAYLFLFCRYFYADCFSELANHASTLPTTSLDKAIYFSSLFCPSF